MGEISYPSHMQPVGELELREDQFVVPRWFGLQGEDMKFYKSLYDVNAGPDDEEVQFPSGFFVTWAELRSQRPDGVIRFVARRPTEEEVK